MSKPSKPDAERLPPGQFLTTNFPVLSYGPAPRFNPAKWDFSLIGMVEPQLHFTWEQFRALPRATEVADFHCVTTWSRYDNHWEGIKVLDLMKLVKLDSGAQYVFVLCDGGYSTNLPLEAFVDDDVMLAWGHDGKNLEPDHGFPLRLVVPKLYAWKSAKWVRAIEFGINDRRGFWEVRGYHNNANPWAEERYSFQEEPED